MYAGYMVRESCRKRKQVDPQATAWGKLNGKTIWVIGPKSTIRALLDATGASFIGSSVEYRQIQRAKRELGIA